jgi:hypothetical protein
MGKLIDKLGRVGKSGGPRLGFGGASQNSEPGMAIVAALAAADPGLAKDAVAAGADAIVAPGASTGAKGPLQKMLEVAEGVPCGLEGGSYAGCDFVLIGPADQAEAALTSPEVDVVLRLPGHAPDSLMRLLESLPVDAVIVEGPGKRLSVESLEALYRAAQATRKPVVAQLPLAAGAPVLQAVRDAGAVAVLVSVDKTSVSALKSLREAIGALPVKRTKASKTRPAVALGLAAARSGDNGEDEQ